MSILKIWLWGRSRVGVNTCTLILFSFHESWVWKELEQKNKSKSDHLDRIQKGLFCWQNCCHHWNWERNDWKTSWNRFWAPWKALGQGWGNSRGMEIKKKSHWMVDIHLRDLRVKSIKPPRTSAMQLPCFLETRKIPWSLSFLLSLHCRHRKALAIHYRCKEKVMTVAEWSIKSHV